MGRPPVESRLNEIQEGIREIRDFIWKIDPSICSLDSKSEQDNKEESNNA